MLNYQGVNLHFPMVFLWFVVFNTVAVAVHGWFPVLCWKSPKNDEGFLR